MLNKNETNIFIKWFLPLFLFLFFIQIVVGSILFFNYSLSQTRSSLVKEIERVKEDVKYTNGQWDTAHYNADSDVPSSNPLYIITSDGFVIDRWRQIHGLLDASEFTRILTYTTPQTISTITNENWRVLSKPIIHDNEVIGVILVTAYKPDINALPTIDQQLSQTIADIEKVTSIQGQQVNVSKLDSRKLPYNITYQIVNKFNKIIAQSDNVNSITRTPTFIDRSYVDSQLKAPNEQQITDSLTKEKFLTETSPLYDSDHEVIGIVVAGMKIDSLYAAFLSHLASFSAISIVLLLLASPLFTFLLQRAIKKGLKENFAKKEPLRIVFNKKDSKLQIDDIAIDIPYASYQYYFCSALFSKHQKRWEVDELIQRFGEEIGKDSWRKIYDTMIALNKKVAHILPEKLFVVQEKTYRLNPSIKAEIILK